MVTSHPRFLAIHGHRSPVIDLRRPYDGLLDDQRWDAVADRVDPSCRLADQTRINRQIDPLADVVVRLARLNGLVDRRTSRLVDLRQWRVAKWASKSLQQFRSDQVVRFGLEKRCGETFDRRFGPIATVKCQRQWLDQDWLKTTPTVDR